MADRTSGGHANLFKEVYMKNIHNDVVTSVFLMLVGVFFILITQTYSEPEAGTFPILFAVLLIITCIPILKSGIDKSRSSCSTEEKDTERDGIPFDELKQALSCFGILLLYTICIYYVGFFVSTAVFLIGTMWLLKVRSILVLIFVPAFLEAAIYFIMVQMLFVRLPQGFLP